MKVDEGGQLPRAYFQLRKLRRSSMVDRRHGLSYFSMSCFESGLDVSLIVGSRHFCLLHRLLQQLGQQDIAGIPLQMTSMRSIRSSNECVD